MTYRGQSAKKLANGEYRLTTHMLWREYMKPLSELAPFKTSGALYGETVGPYGVSSYGRLPDEYRESVHEADYAVFSYGTPIAWHRPDFDVNAPNSASQWVQPDEKYSVTTSRHQSLINVALSQLGEQ